MKLMALQTVRVVYVKHNLVEWCVLANVIGHHFLLVRVVSKFISGLMIDAGFQSLPVMVMIVPDPSLALYWLLVAFETMPLGNVQVVPLSPILPCLFDRRSTRTQEAVFVDVVLRFSKKLGES